MNILITARLGSWARAFTTKEGFESIMLL